MSEDTKLETPETAPEDKAPEYTPIQLKAMEQGWKPKEEFEGDEAEFIDAPEFVRRGELFEKIEHQSREMKNMRQALEALKQHNSKIEHSAYERALKALKDQRRKAILEGEAEQALALEDQIDDVTKERERIAREAAKPAVQEVDPAFLRWVDQNKWYTNDLAMQAVADRVGLEAASRNLPQAEVLRKVEEAVREAFPHKFTNPKRERPSAVEASTRGGKSVATSTAMQLDEDERRIMRKIVSTGALTEKQYLDQLRTLKEKQ